LQKKHISIFYQAHHEISGNPLGFIEKLLMGGDGDPSINEKLFGTRQQVKEIIEKESETVYGFANRTPVHEF
jgi:hypothetical protein